MSELERKRKSGWEKISEDLESRIFQFADEYMDYLNQAKTEREIVTLSEKIAREKFGALEGLAQQYLFYWKREA